MLNQTVSNMDPDYLNTLLVCPDFVTVFVLSFSLFGMYNGIDITHPVYVVLFLNVCVALISSTINICVAVFLPSEIFMRASNGNCWITLVFYCSCWCVNSATRFVYVMFNKELHSKVSSAKVQLFIVVGITLICFLGFTYLLIGMAVSQGESNTCLFKSSFVSNLKLHHLQIHYPICSPLTLMHYILQNPLTWMYCWHSALPKVL